MTFMQVHDNAAFSVADLRVRAEGVLTPPGQHVAEADGTSLRHDFELDPELANLDGKHEKRFAAVLVPIIERDGQASVLFTQRTDDLPTHAGQISFPGGKTDAADANAVETALREAWEEISLDRRFVDPIGFLQDYVTSTGYCIAPLVAVIRQGYSIVPDHNEVADVFDVPLSFLMDAKNHEIHTREWRGRKRQFYAMPYGDRFIWGATAGMLRNLYEWIYEAEPSR
ncbi:MAG: CoA pyrophosphatase [Hyphomicrobiaceae bacterium]|nr:CoA pyrophosphatase [Hyphomicrobiaceae bacterium]